MEGGGHNLSRRNSIRSNGGGSRRGSINTAEMLSEQPDQMSMFGQMKPLKKSKPVSTVKIKFMGKPMELMVPMNDDINIYDGRQIEGSSEAKSRNTWVEMFDMIDLAINNLQQQNKDLKRQVNELNSKVNKISFHDRKDEKNDFNLKKVEKKEPVKTKQKSEQPNGDIDKKFEVKVNKIEENICQWIDEETKTLKETLEKDISSIRSEVDNKNIEINSKVQGSLHDMKEELNNKVAEIDAKLNNINISETPDNMIAVTNGDDNSDLGWVRAVLDLKNKLHKNCNTLRFLCSEPLSVHWSVWYKGDFSLEKGLDEDIVPFNWVNCNVGGALEDDLVSDVTTVVVPVSGPYLIYLGCDIANMSGTVFLRLNRKEKMMVPGRCDIIELDEDDILQVYGTGGTKFSNANFMGCLLRPRLFITPGTTM